MLEQLRKVVRGTEEDDEARPRTDDPARLLFGTLEPFLVDSNFPVRAGQIRRASLLPIWQWLGRDGAPDAARAFETALAEIRQSGSNAGLANWGWADDAYGSFGGAMYFATTGTQTLRIQVREDGLSLDQIVLSADRYVAGAPGATKNDATILAR